MNKKVQKLNWKKIINNDEILVGTQLILKAFISNLNCIVVVDIGYLPKATIYVVQKKIYNYIINCLEGLDVLDNHQQFIFKLITQIKN